MTSRFASFIAAIFLVIAGWPATAGRPSQETAAGRQSASQDKKPAPREFSSAGEISQPDWPSAPVRAAHAMVVSDELLASQAGVEILKRGGNAVDAAVAVAFALAVVEPEAGNIGGGGFMLVRMADGRAGFVDYREVAPAKASREMYRRPDGTFDPEASLIGMHSVAVPGTVAGMELALRTFGTKSLAEVMAPAIRLAESGFPVSPRLAATFRGNAKTLLQFPQSKRIFLKGGAFYSAGETFRQPELAATFHRIAKNGAAEFYSGETAQILTKDMSEQGGLISLEDLNDYKAKIREPLRASYDARGSQWELITSPPPSSGGIATIEALNILAPIPLKGWDDAESVHWVAEAMRRVFADRAVYLSDSDFAYVPVRGLTDPNYAAQLRATIDRERASSSQTIGAGNPAPYDGKPATTGSGSALWPITPAMRNEAEALMRREAARSGHTTHFSVVDAAGNAVANTYTLNDSFGSGVTSSAGFLLNDEMDDFTAHPGQPNLFGLVQSEANTIAPGKRPLSSMMPTIVLRDGKLSFVTGSPGGPQIISATLLSILNWMRLDMDAQAAINAPRFHHQWMPDKLVLEGNFPDGEAQELQSRGYTLVKRGWIGEVEAIGIDPENRERLGAPDPRRQGAAAGY